MAMGREQVLIQIDDALLALLDERAAQEGVSRSELLRRFARTMLTEGAEGRLDRAIAEGYRRIPATERDDLVWSLAVASIEEEPW